MHRYHGLRNLVRFHKKIWKLYSIPFDLAYSWTLVASWFIWICESSQSTQRNGYWWLRCYLSIVRVRWSEVNYDNECYMDAFINLFSVNTLRPRQDARHFPDDIFKCIFLNENVWTSIAISLKFVSKGPIHDIPALVQIMAWRRSGDKPLSEPMMVRLPTHICVTRHQWVKWRSYVPVNGIILSPGKDLPPVRHLNITWTNDDITAWNTRTKSANVTHDSTSK